MNAIARDARLLFRRSPYGTLATLSRKIDGYPFGSITPFVLDGFGRPVILISTLAEHTRNIDADSRVSLLVHEPGAHIQAQGRATLVGDAARIETEDTLRTRYLRYFPEAENYFATHDFFFYRIEPRTIRFIGGFGDIRWVGRDDFLSPPSALESQESHILQHMNTDHGDNLRDYCKYVHHQSPLQVSMLGIDCDGFDMDADGERLRIDFDRPISNAEEARAALVDLARRAKQASAA